MVGTMTSSQSAMKIAEAEVDHGSVAAVSVARRSAPRTKTGELSQASGPRHGARAARSSNASSPTVMMSGIPGVDELSSVPARARSGRQALLLSECDGRRARVAARHHQDPGRLIVAEKIARLGVMAETLGKLVAPFADFAAPLPLA